MRPRFQEDETFSVTVTAQATTAGLAVPMIAQHLGIAPDQVRARLACAPATLAENIEGALARRLVALLAACGIAARLDPTDLAMLPLRPRAELAVILTDVTSLDLAADQLAALLPLPRAAIARRLAAPGGLVLTSRERGNDLTLQRALAGLAGVRLVQSSPGTARYDLFAPTLPFVPRQRLKLQIARLGIQPCFCSGAIASDIDAETAQHLQRHVGSPDGLFAVNRDFQTFDLFLYAYRGLSIHEIIDFFAARGEYTRDLVAKVQTGAPVRIEQALPRAAVEQFCTDYAAIGMNTCPRLSFLPEAPQGCDVMTKAVPVVPRTAGQVARQYAMPRSAPFRVT
jgi:hypothetical protein